LIKAAQSREGGENVELRGKAGALKGVKKRSNEKEKLMDEGKKSS